ncbi:MAG: hypothetical protein GC156_14515 [Actinomycetales bacterium]|nr:hypothetical protein [Actinomycetales bacterium]
MNAVQAIGLFIGVPVAFAIVVSALVFATSWTRGGRSGGDYAASPYLLTSAPAVPDPSRMRAALDAPVVGGGVSAKW